MNLLLLADLKKICSGMSPLLQIAGYLLTIFKIAVPLIIIALAIVDLGKAAISSKPEDIKKSATTLIWRIIGGIIIYLIPSVIISGFGIISQYGTAKSDVDYNVCESCLLHPNSTTCKNAAAANS